MENELIQCLKYVYITVEDEEGAKSFSQTSQNLLQLQTEQRKSFTRVAGEKWGALAILYHHHHHHHYYHDLDMEYGMEHIKLFILMYIICSSEVNTFTQSQLVSFVKGKSTEACAFIQVSVLFNIMVSKWWCVWMDGWR